MQGMIDIHCHIVPGVDDGARDIKEAMRILQKEYSDGVTAVILTPHYRRGMFETSQEEVEKQYRRLRRMVKQSGLEMRLYRGCEYHTNRKMVEDLHEGKRPTMAGSRYVLTEFSSMHGYEVLRNQLYELVAGGYIPIVAHAERYPCLVKKPELIEELQALGAQIQLTAGSILGEEGWGMKRFCMKLLKKRMVQYVATDTHDLKDRHPNLQECAEVLEKKFGRRFAEQILIRNPRKIIKEGRMNR